MSTDSTKKLYDALCRNMSQAVANSTISNKDDSIPEIEYVFSVIRAAAWIAAGVSISSFLRVADHEKGDEFFGYLSDYIKEEFDNATSKRTSLISSLRKHNVGGNETK